MEERIQGTVHFFAALMATRSGPKAKEGSVRKLLLGRGHNNVEDAEDNDERNDGRVNNESCFPVRFSVERSLLTPSQTKCHIIKLQDELNEATVKHSETVYWLQLELNTTRQAKKALEDRMAELYCDMQALESPSQPDASTTKPDDVARMQNQIINHEHMLRVLNNQLDLMRTSADYLVKSLKNDMKDLMKGNAENELKLTNRLAALEREKADLEQQLAAEKLKNNSNFQESTSSVPAECTVRLIPPNPPGAIIEEKLWDQSESPTASASFPIRETAPPRPPCRHKSIEYDDPSPLRSPRRQKSAQDEIETVIDLLEDDLKRLRTENNELREQLQNQRTDQSMVSETEKLFSQVKDLEAKNKSLDSKLVEARGNAHESLVQWAREKTGLEAQVDTLQKKEKVVDEDPARDARDTILASLDRVTLIWDKANESIQSIELAMKEMRTNPSQDGKHVLSVLATACLVHGQIKVSLMLIELQLRNSLKCLKHYQFTTQASGALGNSEEFNERVRGIENEAMESIRKVEALAAEQIKYLRIKSEDESFGLRKVQEEKDDAVIYLAGRQAELEKEVSRLQSENKAESKVIASAVEMVVSQKALETLQSEVLMIVERVKEKNETIGRLSAVIEVHKVRERTLMEELKRHMKNEGDRRLAEQRRMMEQHAPHESSEDGESTAISEYEEKTVEETTYDEITVNEESQSV